MSITSEYIKSNSGLFRAPTNFSMGLNPMQTMTVQTAEQDDITRSSSFQPNLYYDELANYSFLKTLVNLLKAPIAEGIDQINGQIQIMPSDSSSPLYKDAAIIVNNFFEKCNFKQFLKDHLEEFILRGSFLALIDYKNGKLLEVMNPYDYSMINTTKGVTWIIPAEPKQDKMGGMLGSLGNLGKQVNGLFANMFIKYYHEQEVVKKQSREILQQAKENPEMMEKLKAILGGDMSLSSNQKLSEDTKKRIDQITVLYSVVRPRSLFEPFLKKIFTLSIKEMVFDMLSLLQYLKADYFTVSLRADTTSDTAAIQVVNNVKAALNRHTVEFIQSFEDPSGIIRRVYDKLINHNEVLPIVDEFSDIQAFNIPDLEQRLSTLYNDITENKRSIADEVGIAQESVSGSSNRWEAISRNEKMTLNIMYIKSTIENFVKDAACSIFFNHSNETLWDYRYNKRSMPTTFHFSGGVATLSEGSGSLNGILEGIANDSTVKDGNRVGITIDTTDFDFNLNLSTILDSYASKTKETIIGETMQTISGVIDNIKGLGNHADIINPEKTVELVQRLINIGDYTVSIIDPEKLKGLFDQQQQPQEDMGGMEGMDEGMMEEPAYFNYRHDD